MGLKTHHDPQFLMLAPMEGVVDPVLRAQFSKLGGLDRMVTEFVRVTDRLNPAHVYHKYCPELLTDGKTLEGVPVFVQLLGGQPGPMAENAHFVESLGALGVDVNFGCPAKTVNRHDGGAVLLKTPDRLFKILSAIQESLKASIPLTAKVRLGFEDKSLVKEIAEATEQGGAESLVVHARTRKEGYVPPAHWEYIAIMREQIKIPVIANGDIWNISDFKRCREISGCDRFALGRGLVSRPTLALEIKSYDTKNPHELWPWSKLLTDYILPFIESSECYKSENYAVTRTKQMFKFLSRTYIEAEQAFQTLKVFKKSSEIKEFLYGTDRPKDHDIHLEHLPLLHQSQSFTA